MWTVLLVPVTTIILLFFNKLLGSIHLPVFSLPFSVTVILFIYFLQHRKSAKKLILTPFQYYSPEVNLYTYNNHQERYSHFLYYPLYLPFWGECTVSQAHDGKHTHKGEWGKAFDFVLLDEEHKSFNSNGLLCENYYCYNKPVLAPADGVIEEITDNIEDNDIGKINTNNNWGNTIIIRHLSGLYTQLSHLKKGSFKVVKGEYVKRGDLLASCGNSGRSPEPHIHYQVQNNPAIGSKTLEYPVAYYLQTENNSSVLHQFFYPGVGDKVSGVSDNQLIKKAFDIMPDSRFTFGYKNEKGLEKTESWEVFTDDYNYKYLYCREKDTSAYFVNDSTMFYFTAFYGDKKSLLYYFYLTAYKVFLGNGDTITLHEGMPLNIIRNKKISLWIHDFIAPFYNYIRLNFTIKTVETPVIFQNGKVELQSDIQVSVFGKSRKESSGNIIVENNCISGFSYKSSKRTIQATCINR